jgi:hypothetical protein
MLRSSSRIRRFIRLRISRGGKKPLDKSKRVCYNKGTKKKGTDNNERTD